MSQGILDLFDKDLIEFNSEGAYWCLHEGFLSRKRADELFSEFQNEINWKERSIKTHGKEVIIPRLTAWYGDEVNDHLHSGIDNTPNPWSKALYNLKRELEERFHCDLNSVLLNMYRDGNDSVAWHSDDDHKLGPEPLIISVSLGQKRDFVLRKKSNHKQKHKISLSHGDVFIMSGKSQTKWEHSVPKRKNAFESRINLTFRYAYP